MRYRVYCDFIVDADSPEEVFQYLGEQDNWRHFRKINISIGKDDLEMEAHPYHETDEVYADIRRRYK